VCDEKVAQELKRLAEGQNLVPYRRVHVQQYTSDNEASQSRATGTMKRGPLTRAWALRVIAPPTLTDGDDVHAFFAINSEATPAQERDNLEGATGDHLQPGAKHVHILPAYAEAWSVDVAGLQADDLATPADVSVVIELWELVPADRQECGR
jgi:hypothetical protein